MDNVTIILITGIVGLGIGILVGYLIFRFGLKKIEKEATEKSALIIKEAEINAENLKKDKILEAKEKLFKLKADFEEEASRKKNIIISNEGKLKQREQSLSKQMEQVQRKEAEIDSMKENLSAQLEILKKRKNELEKVRLDQVNALEKIANLSREEALEKMMETLQSEAQTKASSYIKNIMEEAKLSANREAKNLILKTLREQLLNIP